MSRIGVKSDFSSPYGVDLEEPGPDAFKPIGGACGAVVSHVEDYSSLEPSCESPIEVMFGVAMTQHIRAKQSGIKLVPQYWWRPYRMDWALFVPGRTTPVCFVECDGKEFHSTDVQVRRDREKDAAAKAACIDLFRFSGSDLFRSAEACAALVYSHVERKR